MITHLNGRLVEKTPTSIVVECNGIGYEVKISLNTYSAIGSDEALKIYTQFAILMLSSLTPSEIAHAITSEDVSTIQSVKGIGAKTAQRVIIDLKDKMLKFEVSDDNFTISNNTTRFDALTALVSLGFDKKAAEKALKKVYADQETVELLIKDALRVL